MDYDAVLAQVLDLLQREQRLSYRVLKLRLQLDDDMLNQTTRNWHAGSTRKHTVPMYAGRDVYESHVV